MKTIKHEFNGDITLYIGDSRDMSDIKDESVNLVITSPPYWKLKDYNQSEQIGFGDDSYESYISNLNKVWSECVRVLAPDGKICINIMPILISDTEKKRRDTKVVITDIEQFMRATGCMVQHALFIWDKRKIVRFSSFGSYPYPTNMFSTYPYEWITVFAKQGKRKVSKEIKEKSKVTQKEWADWAINSIWEMQPARAKSIGHPAPFPEELPKRLIRLFSFTEDTVLDPFVGSGTTLKVARDLDRKSIGFEINEEYLALMQNSLDTLI